MEAVNWTDPELLKLLESPPQRRVSWHVKTTRYVPKARHEQPFAHPPTTVETEEESRITDKEREDRILELWKAERGGTGGKESVGEEEDESEEEMSDEEMSDEEMSDEVSGEESEGKDDESSEVESEVDDDDEMEEDDDDDEMEEDDDDDEMEGAEVGEYLRRVGLCQCGTCRRLGENCDGRFR
ncbi:hypothetical protein BDV96DRAFT_655769 [Lophiotrema nucula]|uniref:Uncharacterized protein n=1 Tax=Lophiotrema nucula TaxID=690887 RepID=A0A6A5YDY8_9PLEO|nr:hypothetical protein BDV96DRAFT_655769 [Lophiotrema nucula]